MMYWGHEHNFFMLRNYMQNIKHKSKQKSENYDLLRLQDRFRCPVFQNVLAISIIIRQRSQYLNHKHHVVLKPQVYVSWK